MWFDSIKYKLKERRLMKKLEKSERNVNKAIVLDKKIHSLLDEGKIEEAEKVLADANRTILMIEGGIQAQVNLLQKIESESQQSGTVDLTKSPKQARSGS